MMEGRVMIKDIEQIDYLARNVAFEIIFGGDRLDAGDVKVFLDGASKGSLDRIRERTLQHCYDFYGESTRSFLERQLHYWYDGVAVGKEELPAGASFRDDRDKWFRLPDGSIDCCHRLLREVEFGKSENGFVYQEVPLREVLLKQAAFLVDTCGQMIPGLEGAAEYNMSYTPPFENGSKISMVERLPGKAVDDLGSYQIEFCDTDGRSSRLNFNKLDDEMCRMALSVFSREISRFEMMAELDMTENILAGSEGVKIENGSVIELPLSHRDETVRIRLESVFKGEDGNLRVEGSVLPEGREKISLRVDSASDKAIRDILVSTDVALKKIMKESPSLNVGRKTVRHAGNILN